MFNRKFIADMAERVIATVAQAALGVLAAGILFTKEGGVTVGVAGLASVLKCLAATRVGADNTAAMLPAGPDTEAGHSELVTVLIALACAVLVYLVMAKVFHV